MNLGEKLRLLRQQRNLTQPELAEAMGIEQSYLSKLENAKSVPSGDVFSRVLDVFQLSVGDLVDDLDLGVRSQLRSIPEVAGYFEEQRRLMIGSRRFWLMTSSILLAVGAALIYAGQVELFVGNMVFTYDSEGIVREGESKEVFLDRERDDPSLEGRWNEDYLVTRGFRGDVFSIPVDGGSRTYHLSDRELNDPWQNKAMAAFGVLLVVLGVTGLVLERKLSRFQ